MPAPLVTAPFVAFPPTGDLCSPRADQPVASRLRCKSMRRTLGGVSPGAVPLVPDEPERHTLDPLKLSPARGPDGPEAFCAVPRANFFDYELHSIGPRQAVSYGGNGSHWFTRYRPGRAADGEAKRPR
jgi:hypothetical protein